MRHFNRLTDIVTCSLTEILSSAADPQAALQEIIHEMEEGQAGANRSVATAQASVDRIERELQEHRSQIEQWTAKAKQELIAGAEDAARVALVRKTEVEDVVAGLEQQQQAAITTRDHLTTMQRAIDARLAELPNGIEGYTTGNAILLTRAADRIARGQAVSLLLAGGMIGLLLVLYFGSIRLGLYALVPNLLPVLL